MFEFILTLIVAIFLMMFMMAIGVAITMPFHGALVRWVKHGYLGQISDLGSQITRQLQPARCRTRGCGGDWDD